MHRWDQEVTQPYIWGQFHKLGYILIGHGNCDELTVSVKEVSLK